MPSGAAAIAVGKSTWRASAARLDLPARGDRGQARSWFLGASSRARENQHDQQRCETGSHGKILLVRDGGKKQPSWRFGEETGNRDAANREEADRGISLHEQKRGGELTGIPAEFAGRDRS